MRFFLLKAKATLTPVSSTHLVYLRSGQVLVDREAIEGMGISCIEVEGSSRGHFDGEGVRKAFEELLS